MVPERPLPPRRVHEYLRATEPVERRRHPADGRRPARRPRQRPARRARRWSRRHLELAREMIGARRSTGAARARPEPLHRRRRARGRAGHRAGARGSGELLAELEAAQYAGEVTTRDEAVEHRPGTARLIELPPRWRAPEDCLFCGIVAGDGPGADRRLRRAHGRLHGHQPGHPRPCPGRPARALRRPDRHLRRRPRAHDARRPAAGPADGRGAASRTASTSSTPAGRRPGRPSSTSTSTSSPATTTTR